MIYLLPNTAAQTMRLSLDEGRQYYSDTFTNYLLIITRYENSLVSGLSIAQVPTIVSENDRITVLTVTTVGLVAAGRCKYEVYGQNSASNTDPDNAVVVGIVENGMVELTDNATYFAPAESIIQDDVRSTQ